MRTITLPVTPAAAARLAEWARADERAPRALRAALTAAADSHDTLAGACRDAEGISRRARDELSAARRDLRRQGHGRGRVNDARRQCDLADDVTGLARRRMNAWQRPAIPAELTGALVAMMRRRATNHADACLCAALTTALKATQAA